MSYSWDNTICIFTKDQKVVNETQKYAAFRNMKLFIAEEEEDLIGVPYWMTVIDVEMITELFSAYLEQVEEPDEKIITHNNPDNKLSKFSEVNEQISFKWLVERFS